MAPVSENCNGSGYPVMGKYMMFEAIAEGTSSICRRAECNATGKELAIKTYKERAKPATMQQFCRQIDVLLELHKPFENVGGPLWSPRLQGVAPSKLFMQLLDHSSSEDGTPGADTSDGELYIITELGDYTLKEYLQQGDRRSRAVIQSLTMAIMLVGAGLHAKGFVHMDLKPENLMVFGGRLKLIDVDGCVEIGSTVSIDDHSLSYSPLYCAPEWAKFLVADSEDDTMMVSPALDVWSIGMTVCELAWHKPIFSKPRGSLKLTEYLGWVGDLKSAPLPASVRDFDEGFVDLLSTCLLVPETTRRKSLIESLDHPFLNEKLTPDELMESPLSDDIYEWSLDISR